MPRQASGLGQRLQGAREAKGLTIADVAAATRISTRAVRAIEEERFDELPGGVFRRTFVRTYAETVGLDGAEYVRAYVAHFEPPARVSVADDALDWPHTTLALAVALVLAALLGGIVAFTA
jgi:cytoskeletal protein RodZ